MSFSNKILQLGVQLRKSDDDRLESFLFGLDDYIKFDVHVMRPTDFNEAVRIALEQEMKHNKGKPKEVNKDSSSSTQNPQNGKTNGKQHSPQSSQSSPSSSQSPKTQNTPNKENKDKASTQVATVLTPEEKVAQGILGGRLTPDKVVSYGKDGRCFNCHIVGHMKKDCPKSRATSSGETSAPAQVNAVLTPIIEPDQNPQTKTRTLRLVLNLLFLSLS